MKLYFENQYGKRRIIAEPESEEEAWEEISKFCENRHYHIHYTRTWRNEEGLKVYDVGSWSEFFYLEDE